ncbi:MAG: hypothetical protein KJP23_14575 [Deltaproteobacteria bacterium]|nr:hypothetical protein [Deltaproteobacteria bacterium]
MITIARCRGLDSRDRVPDVCGMWGDLEMGGPALATLALLFARHGLQTQYSDRLAGVVMGLVHLCVLL